MRDYIQLAHEIGFTQACYFDPQALSFDDAETLRDACKANDCGMYGKFWTCPPGIGSIEKVVGNIKQYDRGMVFQLLTEAINYAIQPEVFSEICYSFNTMTQTLRAELEKDVGETFMLGMSGCTLCEECNYPKAKCRRPLEMVPCISGHCLNVYRLWDSTGNRRARLDESDFYSILLWK
ncbi:MAG: DUF2284 domain-containing protein [Bacillota bacterium]|nr:DUF2284 domain-containing protein [Bacillota bacterium]